MNAAVRALGIGTRFHAPDRPSPGAARPGRPRPALLEALEDPHATACSAVDEEVDMIVAERARVSTARARGLAVGRRKEPA